MKCLNLASFVCVDAVCPSLQFFSHVGTISCPPGLNQHLAEDVVSCSRAQHSTSGES